MNKLLSIIIPAYNMERWLPACLNSLSDWFVEDSPLEVIVVNDGSTDKTSEIAHEFSTRYPLVVRVIDKTNGHYGSAVNAGLAAATGLYIKTLNADDVMCEGALEKLSAECGAFRVHATSKTSTIDDVCQRETEELRTAWGIPKCRLLRWSFHKIAKLRVAFRMLREGVLLERI